MKRSLANKIASVLTDSVTGSESDSYETISLRPSGDVAALVTAFNEVLHQPVLTLFTDEISRKLCELLLQSKENEALIIDLLDQPPEQGSALAELLKQEAVFDAIANKESVSWEVDPSDIHG